MYSQEFESGNDANREIAFLSRQISVARNELKNIRMKVQALRKLHQSSVKEIMSALKIRNWEGAPHQPTQATEEKCPIKDEDSHWKMSPLGYIQTSFKYKNATPRQASICLKSFARLKIDKTCFTNPSHALEGLADFSHVWIFLHPIGVGKSRKFLANRTNLLHGRGKNCRLLKITRLIFIFHKNDKNSHRKGKVAPPRLDGKRIGVFSTRSPHRPNPIGLSLAKLDKIDDDTLYFSGIDLVDGTPVIDIKPFIPTYDQPQCSLTEIPPGMTLLLEDEKNMHAIGHFTEMQSCSSKADTAAPFEQNSKHSRSNSTLGSTEDTTLQFHTPSMSQTNVANTQSVSVPKWIASPPIKPLIVRWTFRAKQQLEAICNHMKSWNERAFKNHKDVVQIITEILQEDPRSVYRRHHCKDQLYYFTHDVLHLTCWIDDCDSSIEIIKVSQISKT